MDFVAGVIGGLGKLSAQLHPFHLPDLSCALPGFPFLPRRFLPQWPSGRVLLHMHRWVYLIKRFRHTLEAIYVNKIIYFRASAAARPPTQLNSVSTLNTTCDNLILPVGSTECAYSNIWFPMGVPQYGANIHFKRNIVHVAQVNPSDLQRTRH